VEYLTNMHGFCVAEHCDTLWGNLCNTEDSLRADSVHGVCLQNRLREDSLFFFMTTTIFTLLAWGRLTNGAQEWGGPQNPRCCRCARSLSATQTACNLGAQSLHGVCVEEHTLPVLQSTHCLCCKAHTVCTESVLQSTVTHWKATFVHAVCTESVLQSTHGLCCRAHTVYDSHQDVIHVKWIQVIHIKMWFTWRTYLG